MLSISVGNQSLDITDDISITLKFQSPLFNDLGDYSFPFKLPLTARNKIILNWKHRIESTDDKHEFFPASVLWEGVEMFSGSLRTQKAGLYYEAVMYVDKGSFNWTIKNSMLHQVDLGSQIVPPNNLTYYNWTLAHYYPETNLCFPPVYNEDYTGVQNTSFGEDTYNFNYTSAPTGIRVVTPQGNMSIIVPMLYLRYVLNRIAQILGYNLIDDFFNKTSDLQNLIIYNSKNIVYTNPQFVQGNMKIFYQQHVPQVTIKAFLQGLENYFNCRFFVNDLTKSITIKSALDIMAKPLAIPFSLGVSELTLLIADQLTGSIMTIKGDDSDSVFTQVTDSDAEYLKIVSGSVQTLSDLTVLPMSAIITNEDVYYVIDVDAYYIATWNGTTNVMDWNVYQNNLSPATINLYRYQSANISKIESDFSCLYESAPGTGVACGNLKTDWKTITPRLMIAKIYLTMRAVTQSSSMDLKLGGSSGIFKRFHQKWEKWILDDRRNVEFKKQLTFLDIRDLDFSAKYEINGTNYLLNTVSVSITKMDIKPAIINAYTIF